MVDARLSTKSNRFSILIKPLLAIGNLTALSYPSTELSVTMRVPSNLSNHQQEKIPVFFVPQKPE